MATTKQYPEGTWTPTLRKAIEQCDSSVLRVSGKTATLELTKEVKQNGPFGERERKVCFTFPGYIRTGKCDGVDVSKDDYGTVMSYSSEPGNVYQPQEGMCFRPHYDLRNVAALIPYGAELSFEVYLDGGANGYAAKHRVHLDLTYLHIRKGESHSRVLIDTSLCEHNSARFGCGHNAPRRLAEVA